MKKIANSQELKIFWNEFQKDYTTVIEPSMLSLYTLLFNSSNILATNNLENKKKSILELACGGGSGLEYMCNQLISREIEAEIYATDISDNMLNCTFNRLKKLNKINLNLLNSDDICIEKVDNNSKINVFLKEADNENLPFKENNFDMIISSLSLHLVSNPDNMIKECNRVLKNDGYAFYSLWGRPEKCLPFTVLANNLKKFGLSMPDSRSNFHLSEHEILRDLFKRNGINDFKIQTTFIPFNFTKAEDYTALLKGFKLDEITSESDNETKQKIINSVFKDVDDVLKSEEFFGIEAFILRSAKIDLI